jgi:hypothetical protein
MGRIRTAGLVKRGDVWHIDKTIGGKRLCESTGETELNQVVGEGSRKNPALLILKKKAASA